MFAVKPRHWPANIRANAVDIIVGLSALIFMAHSGSAMFQLVWAIGYGIWLLAVKPLATTFGISLQALISQALGLTALFIAWGDAPVWLVIGMDHYYNTARHFLQASRSLPVRCVGLFCLQWCGFWSLANLLWSIAHRHYVLVLSFGLGGMYYLQKTDRMSVMLRRQIVFVMVAIVVIVLAFSQWGDKTI
jgi:hypothetical protein